MIKQPWLGNPFTEIVFILLPPFLCLLVIMLFPSVFQNTREVSLAGWVILVLLIDVGHVYSTLYRTYFDTVALRKQRAILFAIPFFSFVAGVLIYSMSSLWFWRILAYIAVFHFIRQQYGFMRLYSRKEPKKNFNARLDTIIIYTATLYPLLYWHLKGPRNFSWFIENDFYFIPSQTLLLKTLTTGYFILIGCYLFVECIRIYKTRFINIPKLCIIGGTLLSWYFGIVYFNGDMAFTLLNVVSHGIPYMALIWIHGKKLYNKPGKENRFLTFIFSKKGFLVFILSLFLFAFMEESLWDLSVWKEHQAVFGLNKLPDFKLNYQLLSIVIPLLTVPQLTHYILDGFIWKIEKEEIKWKSEVSVPAGTIS